MSINTSQFYGMIPPLVTPLHANGSLNLGGVPALVEYVLAGGVQGIFSPGSQGEAFALTANERTAVLEAVLQAVGGRVPVIAGTGAITTREAILLTRQAEEAGADAVAIVTPYFITPSQQELYVHYTEIAAAVPLPIFGYSNPGRTGGVTLTPETLARLAKDIPYFIGVKDSGSDLAALAETIRSCPADFRVFVGRDTLIYGGLCYGAAGAVGMTMNIMPQVATELYRAFSAGDHHRARVLQAKISQLHQGLPTFGTYPVWVKEALMLMGLPAGPARRPILPLNDEQRAALQAFLQTLDVALESEQ